ncbi:Major facilitator coppper-regulated transporter crmC [Penicillium atrosanguineum]|uniref:Major facilitator coppper-regulated transporter crmC n=1 Tax=Penicillium atrosanguineum TaxID=1132637 RepID=UPI002396D339|nr:Major facilitator coppper-regulated transporter crmC [Penicillium atrosanguineum]KAJ5289634.1 Major facilitator coppper-regulated transporter crmC [Penicillium atrosanguineum]
MGTGQTEAILTRGMAKSGEWPLPSVETHAQLETSVLTHVQQGISFQNRVQNEDLEVDYLQSRSSTPHLDTAEVVRVLSPGPTQSANSARTRRGPPSVAHSLASPSISESGEGEDPSSMARYLARRATLLGWFDEGEVDNGIRTWSSTCIAKSLIVESTSARIPIVYCLNDVNSELVHFARACIIVQEKIVLVWSHDSGAILNVAFDVERQLGRKGPRVSNATTPRISGRSSPLDFDLDAQTSTKANSTVLPIRGALDEKHEVYSKAVALEEGTEEDETPVDLEGNLAPRPAHRIHAFKISFAIMLVILTQALGVSRLINEYAWDGGYIRFALVVTIPPLALFSLFFFIVIVTSAFQLFLPASFCLKNSKFHSAIKPNPKFHRDYELPHITIQMPVYKEGLKGVIVPTMMSVLAAVQFYEEQGGTASVFINDDGMQCIQPELAEARRQYYRENGIGYTARLPNKKSSQKKKSGRFDCFRKSKPVAETTEVEEEDATSPQAIANKIGFERKGKFKKASNMNYGLAFSNRVEDEMVRLTELECQQRGCTNDDLVVEDDDRIYKQALTNMLAEDEGRTWAEGNIRIGEHILIIDCDTRVPIDCLLYGALEMHESPEVAIIQHGSGVMQVVHNMFENGIAYFTDVVYTAIKYGVGSGDVSPFVGHNAFLRWKAIQSIQFVDPSDGETKWWSDAHVSEDFDISLRLQMRGMTVRLATYHNRDFKEGVSLTLYDELTRWEKYAYGCNELVFHPFYKWPYKGPVTRLFLRFLWSNMPVTSKVTIIAYIFTYYAIGSGMLLATVNYVIVGLFNSQIDHIYLRSWGIWISLVVIFNGVGSVAFSMARHQLKEKVFYKALLQSVMWLPFLIIYFGGISLNCAKAILCHAFSINIEWSSTAKEPGPGGFFIGLDRMVKKFKYTWAICLFLTAAMVVMALATPWGWQIKPGEYSTASIAIGPLAIQVVNAAILPLVLGLN